MADDPVTPAIVELVREHRRRYDLPVLATHPNDEMRRWAAVTDADAERAALGYTRAGLAIADTVRRIVELHEAAIGRPVAAVLDFACGYGRSLRFTAQDVGPDRVWGSEILPLAVDFVHDAFGVHSFASCPDPADLHVEQRFDVIVVSSLFSHLPRRTFTPWLRALHCLLATDGLLCISVHDEVLLLDGTELADDGFYFQATTEIDDIEAADYGATIVNESFMAAAVAEATGQPRYRRLPTALCFLQDLYLIPAADAAPLPTGSVSHGAQGNVDACTISDTCVLDAFGWAGIQDDDDAVTTVEVRIGGHLVAAVPTGFPRTDVAEAFHQATTSDLARSGWSCLVTLDRMPRADETLLVVAETRRGRRDVVWSTSLGMLGAGEPTSEVAPVAKSSVSRRLTAAGRKHVTALRHRVVHSARG